MRLFHQIEDFPKESENTIITIGNFDGMHKGHASVLEYLDKLARSNESKTLITFSNHPSQVLNPNATTPLLCTSSHKLKLIEEFGIDNLFLLPFTKELSQLSAELFIEKLKAFIPFSHLVLGHDAKIGKERQGDKSTMQKLAQQWDFRVHYLEAFELDGIPISSTIIRHAIQAGDFEKAELYLGRPYSIYSTVTTGEGKGKLIGFPTANIDISGLCLPPKGVYAVKVIWNNNVYSGIANLGVAPTIKSANLLMLEVHLLEFNQNLYQKNIEVIFQKFIRPERKFNSVDELKVQIKNDIATC